MTLPTTPTSSDPILAFDTHVTVGILHALPLSDLLSACLINKSWNALIKANSESIYRSLAHNIGIDARDVDILEGYHQYASSRKEGDEEGAWNREIFDVCGIKAPFEDARKELSWKRACQTYLRRKRNWVSGRGTVGYIGVPDNDVASVAVDEAQQVLYVGTWNDTVLGVDPAKPNELFSEMDFDDNGAVQELFWQNDHLIISGSEAVHTWVPDSDSRGFLVPSETIEYKNGDAKRTHVGEQNGKPVVVTVKEPHTMLVQDVVGGKESKLLLKNLPAKKVTWPKSKVIVKDDYIFLISGGLHIYPVSSPTTLLASIPKIDMLPFPNAVVPKHVYSLGMNHEGVKPPVAEDGEALVHKLEMVVEKSEDVGMDAMFNFVSDVHVTATDLFVVGTTGTVYVLRSYKDVLSIADPKKRKAALNEQVIALKFKGGLNSIAVHGENVAIFCLSGIYLLHTSSLPSPSSTQTTIPLHLLLDAPSALLPQLEESITLVLTRSRLYVVWSASIEFDEGEIVDGKGVGRCVDEELCEGDGYCLKVWDFEGEDDGVVV
ncbi:hypothetical protein I350_05534 [Cryptococcus amylolentus CBS 6273]|uniref:F-box domain-containing protein n=1 Tax=Cryptococcus amylolentus CBS 6273 TaxID=1296118 RepID=A0A1E3JVP9_9TREE|nr:hypothetical protein I350_05534 [Cryptococcus amylolentus CBS 6273]